ncbi:MAG: hypothetical protein IMW97_08605 [Firmicutes bacterium]|nr:hypothetical protein [Candidatus Fermentithermobacillaceae bacterium]
MSVIRKMVGYNRYDTETELNLLNRIYNILRPYQNFFQPSVKLISKERVGSKVIKRYDTPATPYQRVLASEPEKNRELPEFRSRMSELFASKGNSEVVEVALICWDSQLTEAVEPVEKNVLLIKILRSVTIADRRSSQRVSAR